MTEPFPTLPPAPELWHHELHATVHDLREQLIELSLDLHAHPELALVEHHAAQRLTELLAQNSFATRLGVAGLPTAFDAHVGSGKPVVALLCEYDALPDIGHACGHNLIAAGGIGAAIAASRVLGANQHGTIRCIGTPGEEGAGGKIIELDAGVFDDVDVALMWHPSDKTLPWRHATAAVHLDITYRGIAAHAAGNPEDGRSALAAVIQLFTAIDSLRQFIPETARLHGIITDGGQAPNVVPERAAASLMVRATTQTGVTEILSRVEACAHAAAESTGTSVELNAGRIYAERKNNHSVAARTAAHLARLGVPSDTPVLRGGTGSSDIGNVSLAIPAIHPYLQIMPRGTPSHSRAMASAAASTEAQERMLIITEALAATAIELLTQPALLQTAKDEFSNSTADFPQ